MKIAQVAPLYESVPPKYYGGTERIVSHLTEALVKLGHEVTLYASGDSSTSAELRAFGKKALRLDPESQDPVADHVLLAERILRDSNEFDFIHSHIDYIGFQSLRRITKPHVTTLHGRLDIPNLRNLYREFSDIPVVSISNSQQQPLTLANWKGTVYHGIPENLFKFHRQPGKYLAFIGRLSHEKRVDLAIEIAGEAGIPLKIAAKLDRVDMDYFKNVVRPLMDTADVEYIGEIGETQKNDFLGNAYALLFPIDWPEPFGLVMIEAMACGTPVIAHRRGAVPEIIESGVSGFITADIKEDIDAVAKISALDRAACRKIFEARFTAERMAQDYLKIYTHLIDSQDDKETLQLYG